MHGILSFHEFIAHRAEKLVAIRVGTDESVLKVLGNLLDYIGSVVVFQTDETIEVAYNSDSGQNISYRTEHEDARHRA